MKYSFLVDTYETERIKILSVSSEFRDEDMRVRPRDDDPRGRSVLEQMVHQCVSEDAWFQGRFLRYAVLSLHPRDRALQSWQDDCGSNRQAMNNRACLAASRIVRTP